jgi:hypothetical protein
MVARTCVLLLLAAGLLSCRSVPVEAQAGGELGPVKILLYAELKDATYGWLGDEPTPASIEPVTYSYSANFKELERAVDATIAANAEGQHKAVSAVVTGQRIEKGAFQLIQIRSSQNIRIVDVPADLYEAWQAAMRSRTISSAKLFCEPAAASFPEVGEGAGFDLAGLTGRASESASPRDAR